MDPPINQNQRMKTGKQKTKNNSKAINLQKKVEGKPVYLNIENRISTSTVF